MTFIIRKKGGGGQLVEKGEIKQRRYLNLMAVRLQKAYEKDKTILKNLYSLYLHDLSKYTNELVLGEDGSFHFDELDSFWQIEGLSPYLIMYEENIIGFLLLLERPFLKKEYDYGVNDIFIIQAYRGKGLGRQILKQLFFEKQGKYFVIELVANEPAVGFWKRVYKELGINFEEKAELIDNESCLIQTFCV